MALSYPIGRQYHFEMVNLIRPLHVSYIGELGCGYSPLSRAYVISQVLALMRHTRCLNKFYYPTDDRNMKAKLFIQKCKDD